MFFERHFWSNRYLLIMKISITKYDLIKKHNFQARFYTVKHVLMTLIHETIPLAEQ